MEDKDTIVLQNLIQYLTDAFKLRESELAMPKMVCVVWLIDIIYVIALVGLLILSDYVNFVVDVGPMHVL